MVGSKWFAAMVPLVLAAVPDTAEAQTFATASYSQYTYAAQQELQSTTAGNQLSTNGVGCADYGACDDRAATSISTSPMASLSASVSSPNGGTTQAESQLEFFVTVSGLGSSYSGIVPLHMIGKMVLSASSQNAKAAGTIVLVDTPQFVSVPPNYSPPTSVVEYHCGDGDLDCGTFDFNAQFFTTYTASQSATTDVFFDAEARTFEGDILNAHYASILIDPIFSIDADFLAEHPDAVLTVTEGIGNGEATSTDAVPEPASWAMMIAGFGLVGAMLRRRTVTSFA